MRIIDLRSDTVTKPTEEMREAMRTCPVGDDVFIDDPTVNRLEELGAEMLGKEAAIFVPTGTFGNQMAIFTHCSHGTEIIVCDPSHVLVNEAGAASVIAGVQTRCVEIEGGYIDPKRIESKICIDDDIHHPITSLICIENALWGGQVITEENMREIYEVGQRHGVPVHCDGARLFNAAVALGVPITNLTRYLDSVCVCLSKGLAAPVGSLVAGTKEFIHAARARRKLMGGGMRQAGVIAAPGIIALEKMTKRLHIDHENAQRLAKALNEVPGLSVDFNDVQINMVFFSYNSEKMPVQEFLAKLGERGIVSMIPRRGDKIRFACHNDVTTEDVDAVIGYVKEILA